MKTIGGSKILRTIIAGLMNLYEEMRPPWPVDHEDEYLVQYDNTILNKIRWPATCLVSYRVIKTGLRYHQLSS